MAIDELLALARFQRLTARNSGEEAKIKLLGEMADEIERLTYIQREFHNLDDVVEIRRLKNDIQELTCGDPRKVCPNCRGALDVPVVQEARPIARCDACERVADSKLAGQRCFMEAPDGALCGGTLFTVL